MKTISFDVMGNDHGVKAAVQAALQFVQDNPHFKIKMVGDQQEINRFLTVKPEQIEVFDVKKTVNKNLGILALRKEKSSMGFAINLVKNKEADVVISSGDSGSYLGLSTILLQRIKNVQRPAFMPVFPTVKKGKKFLMIDVGANLQASSEMLYQWAKMANVFAKKILKVQKPSISIVNIGTEKGKGFEFQNAAGELLTKDRKLNYKGFIEPRYLLDGQTDIAVVDGYGGNYVLKTMEGTILSFTKVLKQTLQSKFLYKIGALLIRNAFRDIAEQLDYRNVGSAWVLGLNALALKAHGSSDTKAYLGAFNQIKMAVESNLIHAMEKDFA